LRNEEFGPNGELLPEEVRAFFYEGKGRPPKSYIRRRPNGTVLEIRSDPMPDGSLIQTYTDITELAQAKDAAEAAARAKTNFLAVMSHEIRTPLNGVIGAAQAMRSTSLGESQARYLETISSCGDALLMLVNDILDFSRLEAAGVALQEAACDPAEVLRAAFLVTKAAGEAKGLDMALEGLDDLPPAIVADAARLRQALINLLGNAVKFTSGGGVALIAEVSGEAGGPAHARRLRLSVRDTGIGVSEGALERVFDKFEQESANIQSLYGGAGLGLAITRAIIEAMDGRVGVVSQQGEGSTFWLEIPLIEADDGSALALAKAAADAAVLSPAHCRPQRILVAEDVATNQLVIEATLTALGHSVAIVGDGAAALARAQCEEFDLIMLDMRMPKMDGLEAARALRALGGAFATIPIIALTANAFGQDREACAQAGMDAFLSKPFNYREMSSLIARLTAGGSEAEVVDDDAAALVEMCQAECAQLLQALSQAAAQDDSRACARALHGLRALMQSAELGEPVTEACGQLLDQAMAGRALSLNEAHALERAAHAALEAACARINEISHVRQSAA
jgi:signal transduction histidine kinase/DNA-binding response OmpR family regulator